MSQLFAHEQSVKTSDDYLTPRWVFDALGLEFDLDVASPPWETHVPAARKFTKADDGLSQEWTGRVWMNPPFSEAGKWVRRFVEHAHGVAIVPMSKSDWLIDLWTSPAVLTVPRSILRQWGGEGSNQIQFMVMFAAFGDDCVQALGKLGRVR